ncbi:hypothetical protein HDU88_008852 [Geranomyces variabilis]|nr:hypothetical protein HDU88_008852 [Geranomyces variabilis]
MSERLPPRLLPDFRHILPEGGPQAQIQTSMYDPQLPQYQQFHDHQPVPTDTVALPLVLPGNGPNSASRLSFALVSKEVLLKTALEAQKNGPLFNVDEVLLEALVQSLTSSIPAMVSGPTTSGSTNFVDDPTTSHASHATPLQLQESSANRITRPIYPSFMRQLDRAFKEAEDVSPAVRSALNVHSDPLTSWEPDHSDTPANFLPSFPTTQPPVPDDHQSSSIQSKPIGATMRRSSSSTRVSFDASVALCIEVPPAMVGKTPSARSRAKKRLREQTLEQVAQTMTGKVDALSKSIGNMNREIWFLRGLVADRDGSQALEAHYTLNGLQWPHDRSLNVSDPCLKRET